MYISAENHVLVSGRPQLIMVSLDDRRVLNGIEVFVVKAMPFECNNRSKHRCANCMKRRSYELIFPYT